MSEWVDLSCDYLLDFVVSLVDLVGLGSFFYLFSIVSFCLLSSLSLIVLTIVYLIYLREDGVIFLYFFELYDGGFLYDISDSS